ncbi:MAG: diguanylate cyclase domain-containing protein [Moraxellaceae bacterium]
MTAAVSRHTIAELLRQGLWQQPIPVHLAEAYRERRLSEFMRLVNIGWPLLVLMYVGMNVFNFFLYGSELRDTDLTVMLATETCALLLIVGGIFAAHSTSLRRHFTVWVPVVYALIILCKLSAGLLFESAALARNQIPVMMLVAIVGTLALRLTLPAALAGNLLAWSFFLPPLFGSGQEYAFTAGAYFGLTFMVALFVATLQEERDRLLFMHTVLLGEESKEVRRLNEELRQMASHDSLTGLANRRHFDERFSGEWERACRQQSTLALLIVDVDHFKSYNDHYGHPEGDDCLAQVARAISRTLRRPGDLAARYGGEEFVILLPDTDLHGAIDVAERLLAAVDGLALPHANSSVADQVTVSIGLSIMKPVPSVNRQILLSDADTALYRAKRAGRHRHVVSTALLDPADTHGTAALH